MTQLKAPRKTGHWLRDDVPHSGWRCERIADSEDIFTRRVTICEMCEVTGIVHQHVMTHETLPGVELMCGVCAAFMTDNAEQERLREVLYKWRQDHRHNLTPVENLRRKGCSGYHSSSGNHQWTFYQSRGQGRRRYYTDKLFIVEVKNHDGWRYSIYRPWWNCRDVSKHIDSEPFASDIETATAGIERAELLLADPQWLQADREAEAAYWAAAEAKRKEQELRSIIQHLTEYGCPDLAAALEQGRITPFDAFMEMRRRRDAA